MRNRTLLSLAAVPLLLAAVVGAQAGNPGQYPIPIPERLERPTVEDEDGLLQWADLDELSREERLKFRCPTCEGKGKQECPFCWRLEFHEECPECHTGPDAEKRIATCRTCGGEGQLPDILEKAPCPGCFGAGLTRCHACGGEGNYPAGRNTDRRATCPVCRGDMCNPCNVCDGERFVEPPPLRPSVGEAELEDLREMRAVFAAVAEELAKVESTGDARKDAKLWKDVLRPGLRYLPCFRPLLKDLERNTKDMAKGTMFVAYADMVRNSTNEKKQYLDYYLRHQTRLLELCIARAEHNAEQRDDGD